MEIFDKFWNIGDFNKQNVFYIAVFNENLSIEDGLEIIRALKEYMLINFT